ncbi:ParB/RepB/Spo0J family partition protein [Blastococcus sp. CT_GayMR16]|uniref:ParB/RepB/Spo0J family partition protein n=1 Tax=Blastococcus sp. CT_GayMR16 TaxID=2559607 RepID=UPI00142F9F55|nr:ParB/RepB/Spo0J family partition protein [Blastococcus sp. CT_GayMR16]
MTTQDYQLLWLDPRALAQHPLNVRSEIGDITSLTDSIRTKGVIEPLTVVPLGDGGHQIVAGHRRTAAAIAAELELVPAIARADMVHAADDRAGAAEHVATMLAENVHRQNLTSVEVARGVQEMLDLGVTIAKVAKSTGLDPKRIKLAAGVARLDEPTAAAVAAGGLDLEQAAVVALYADDTETTTRLVEAAEHGAGNFAHAATRAQQDRKARELYLAKVAELQAAGRTLVDKVHMQGAKNRSLGALEHDGKSLTDESHASCPGSAVCVVEDWNGPRVREVCTDFAKYGHVDAWAVGPSKPTTAEGKKAAADERRQLIEDNKAMAAANATRRQWIRTVLLERRRGEKDVLRFAVEAVTTFRGDLRGWLDSYQPDDAAKIRAELGLQPPWKTGAEGEPTLTSGEGVTDARLPLQLLAHVAAAIELTITKDVHRKLDIRQREMATWLTFLTTQGYTLADIEKRILDAAAKAKP